MRGTTGLWAMVALTAAALVLVPGAIGGAQQTTKITVCYANSATDFTNLLAASKESFAGAAEGLEIVPLRALGTGPQLLQQGACQIGVGSGPEHMLLYAAGVDVAMVGGWQNRFGFKLLVRTDRGIDKPTDLKGHNLGVSTVGGPPDQSARALLKTLNLVPDKDVDIVYIPSITSRLAALAQGSLDSAIFSPPVKQITADGKVKDILDLSFLRFISLAVWTKRDYAVENPQVIKGFLRATVKTNAWLKKPANKEKVLQYISQMTSITNRAGLEEAYKYGILEHLPYDPVIDSVALRNSVQYVRDNFGKNLNADDFTYFRLLEQVLTYKISGNLKPRGGTARGTFSATLKQSGQLAWRLSTSRLSGPATSAQVHVAAPGKTGPGRLTLCRKCGSRQTGTRRIDSRLARAIKDGQAYVSVRTARSSEGEIRGQLVAALGK